MVSPRGPNILIEPPTALITFHPDGTPAETLWSCAVYGCNWTGRAAGAVDGFAWARAETKAETPMIIEITSTTANRRNFMASDICMVNVRRPLLVPQSSRRLSKIGP